MTVEAVREQLACPWAENEERVVVAAVEGRDLASLAVRLADCAQSVHGALLDAV